MTLVNRQELSEGIWTTNRDEMAAGFLVGISVAIMGGREGTLLRNRRQDEVF